MLEMVIDVTDNKVKNDLMSVLLHPPLLNKA